jgi:hypothetical protein
MLSFGFVSGHDFKSGRKRKERESGFNPCNDTSSTNASMVQNPSKQDWCTYLAERKKRRG